jgi:hypothetical protein
MLNWTSYIKAKGAVRSFSERLYAVKSGAQSSTAIPPSKPEIWNGFSKWCDNDHIAAEKVTPATKHDASRRRMGTARHATVKR